MTISLKRDSANPFSVTVRNKDTVETSDISGMSLRFEFSQNGTTVTVSNGDGISFATDGTDGKFNFLMSKAKVNTLCVGVARVRVFDDAAPGTNGDPLLMWEGSASIEGRSFDA